MTLLKYFFFSDSHIADGTEKDDFSQDFQQDEKFKENLETMKDKGYKIVGVGDIFELWQASHDAIKKAHTMICHWLKFNVKLLKGNHDFSTFAPERMTFTTKSGKRVLVIHGHQSNPKMLKWYTRGIIFIVGKLERFFPWLDNPSKHPKLYKLLPGKYRKIFQEKLHKQSSIEKDVENYCRRFIGKYDIVICGHSHKQGYKTLMNKGDDVAWIGSILMLNCGHNTNGAFQGVLFDANTDKWELV